MKENDNWAEKAARQKFGKNEVFTNEAGHIHIKFDDEARARRIIDELQRNNMMVQYHRNQLDYEFRQGALLWRKINQIIREKLGDDTTILITSKYRIDVDFITASIVLRPRVKKKGG